MNSTPTTTSPKETTIVNPALPSTKKQTKTQRAETICSVDKVLRRLRNAGICPRVRDPAGIAATAFLDEFVGAVMQDTVFTTLENKKTRLRPRYVAHAIALDASLKHLYNGAIPEGGVEPNIHSVLLPKRRGGTGVESVKRQKTKKSKEVTEPASTTISL